MADPKEQAALSGAASGASAGASFGPWGAVIGGVIGGGLGYAGGGGGSAPPPTPLSGPSTPGTFATDYMGWEIDPVTGSARQVSYGFDPTTQGDQLDADMMWNSFLGRDNSSQVNAIEWKQKEAQQD